MVHAPGVLQAGARIDGFLTESGEGGGEGELGEGAAVEGLDADVTPLQPASSERPETFCE